MQKTSIFAGLFGVGAEMRLVRLMRLMRLSGWVAQQRVKRISEKHGVPMVYGQNIRLTSDFMR